MTGGRTSNPARPLHVLILTLVFPPDSVSTAQIVGDLVVDLRQRGVDVTVLTTTPHYNPPADVTGLPPWFGRLVRRSCWAGAPVYHCAMPRKSASVAARVASWVAFHAVSTVLGAFVHRPVDVVFAPSPPLTIGVSAWIVGLLHRAPYVYNVQELYPDIAVSLGALRKGPLLRLLLRLERFVYSRAALVTVIAERMKTRLISKGVAPDKVAVVPNFVDLADFEPGAKVNPFSREFGVADRFAITYAGNLGPAQGLEAVLDAAAQLRDEPRVRFLFVGDGVLRNAIKSRIERDRLDNCQLAPYQPYSRMRELYAASDLSLVPQAPAIGSEAIPSKVYRIMACGRAVLALTDADSDLARLVQDADCGCVVQPGDAAGLAAVVRQALGRPERFGAMGENGRAHLLGRYERRVVTSRYHDFFCTLASR